MVRDALGYLDGLARESGEDPSLQRELAGAYHRIGDLQGGEPSSLGDTTTAGVHTGDGEVTITPSTECDDTPTTTAAPTTTVAAPTTTTPKVEAQAAKPVAARPVYAG